MSTERPEVAGGPYTEPDFSSAALITIDAQRDALDGGPLEIRGTSKALGPMRALAQGFRDAGGQIVHVVRLYEPDGSNVDLCRRSAIEDGLRALLLGTEGSQLAGGLLPEPGAALDHELLLGGAFQQIGTREAVIYKPRWGAFYETALEGYLRERQLGTLVFSGCNFPNCPRTSIYEASERDFRIVLARDAVSGLYERGEAELIDIGVHLMGSEDIVNQLRPPISAPT
jgi:nicotinamidase-related amidase